MSDKENGELDDTNISVKVECTEECHSDDQNAQYLLVDYAEKLVTEVETARLELHKQAISILEKTELLWEVVRTFITLILPVITGLGLTLLSRICLPCSLAPWIFTVFFGITVGFIFLNLPPLADAVGSYLSYKAYTPQYANCQCDVCKMKMAATTHRAKAGTVDNEAEDIGCAADSSTLETPSVPDLNEID